MRIPELSDELSSSLKDGSYEIHQLTVTLAGIASRAQDDFRREEFVVFCSDMGYFINEKYLDMLREMICKH